MATFPAIEPNRRSYGFGTFPGVTEAVWPDVTVEFLTGDDPFTIAGVPLTLTYLRRREAEIQLIRNHYAFQQGGTVDFTLPAIIWQGNSSMPLSSARWRYTSPPQEDHKGTGLIDVTIELVSVGTVVPDPEA